MIYPHLRAVCRSVACLLCFVLHCLPPSAAVAAENGSAPPNETAADGQTLSLRGFATLGLAYFNSSDFGIVSSFAQRSPVFDRWSPDLDSVVGGQMELRPTRSDAVVVQAVARAGEGWTPGIGLGFWQHRFESGISIRGGRLASPVFHDSDIINVGYANLTIRPALPVYMKINAMPRLDGFDVYWQTYIRDTLAGIQYFTGSTSYKHHLYRPGVADLDVSIRDVNGLAVTAQHGAFSLRLSRSAARRYEARSVDIANLNSGLDQLAVAMRAVPGLAGQADALAAFHNAVDGRPSYSSVGLDWSAAGWQAMSEWTRTDSSSSVVGVTDAWQLTLARTINRLTPYGFVSRQTTKQPPLNAVGFAPTGVPALDAGLAGIYAEIAELQRTSDLSMRSIGIGLRYDLRENMAVKFQMEHMRVDVPFALAPGVAVVNGPRTGNLFSATMDFSF